MPAEPGVMDARQTLLKSPLHWRQVAAIGLCIFLNALDGFDVLSISFAAPGIVAEWGIDRAALGIVLSMELVGMALGSVLLGQLADRIGRRPVLLGCVVVMAAGMMLAGRARSIEVLSLWRFLTGIGIGGMLATISATVAEVSNARRRNLAVALMSCGYPLGAVAGGSIVSSLLITHDWRAVFEFGALVTAACLPLAWWLVPESIEFLLSRGRPADLAQAGRIMAQFGHRDLAPQAPAAAFGDSRAPRGALWSGALARTTFLLTLAYFTHILTFYFLVKWIPKVVVDMGFPASSAGGVLVWTNVGGAAGALLFSALVAFVDVRRLTIVFLLLSSAAVVLFGRSPADLTQLSLFAGLAGFCTNAVIIGIYALTAASFPAEQRASGVGAVIGIGRGGAALGPIAAGFLFAAGWSLPLVAAAMALGSLVGAAALVLLARRRRS
ncbi:MFS transporter [Sphingomonas hengshuiensis]|uniref:MFS transporter n=1 Tax=Sphingomonas hengshuiensis TaxID=1609977 RepID=A0A7U5BE86_9SPHN|nr:MFS transporter [Sphingomonas hengshuiensis]AJP70675.1 MFS transporter [Sphingomonas hengshuiensis]